MMFITKLKFKKVFLPLNSLNLTCITTIDFTECEELIILQFPIFKESLISILFPDPIERYQYRVHDFIEQNIPEGEAWFLVESVYEYLNSYPRDHCEYYNQLYDKTVRTYENGGPEWMRI